MKKTEYEVVVDHLNVFKIDDMEALILSKKKELQEKGIIPTRCSIELSFSQIIIKFHKQLTQEEVDILKKEQDEIEAKKLEVKKQRAEKAAESAKKAWITRKANQEKEELKRLKAAEASQLLRDKKRAEKEAIAEKTRKEKEFLHNLLYGED